MKTSRSAISLYFIHISNTRKTLFVSTHLRRLGLNSVRKRYPFCLQQSEEFRSVIEREVWSVSVYIVPREANLPIPFSTKLKKLDH